jgi:hypothetical protein
VGGDTRAASRPRVTGITGSNSRLTILPNALGIAGSASHGSRTQPRWLFVARTVGRQNYLSFGVILFSLATGEKQCVASSGSPEDSDIGLWFSLSPDGRTIAFLRTSVSACCDIYTIPTSGGAPHQLTSGGQLDCTTLNDQAARNRLLTSSRLPGSNRAW